jgi:hypothetical protein
VPIVFKSGILNLLDPSWPLQACNGIALPIAVKILSTGTISLSFKQYLSNIPGKHDIKEIQQTDILNTAHVLR